MNDRDQAELTPRCTVRWIVETAVLCVIAFVIAMTFRATVASAYEIPTPSMEPTIMSHDRVIAEKVSVHFDEPAFGDVVVITDPAGGRTPFIKRVIATAGQTIDVHDGAVWVDGKRLDEPYTHGKPSMPLRFELPTTVPTGCIWVMGDNRTNSKDSREFGPVPTTSVQAKAAFVYWPPAHIATLAADD